MGENESRSVEDILRGIDTIKEIDAVPTILQVVCEATGMGFAAVARVSDSRWIACEVLDNIHFGLMAGGELPVETTICSEIRELRREIVIDHVAEDPDYAAHHTPALYGFQSYISVPIILSTGEVFGTLCAIDPHPRKLKGTAAVGMFRMFAQLIAFHLDAHWKLQDTRSDLARSQSELQASGESLGASREALTRSQSDFHQSQNSLEESRVSLAASQLKLSQELATGELREQFVAVLGHDLRNPLASFASGVKLLSRDEADPKRIRILRLMNESAQRMGGLIDNLLDFARGRLGSGIGIEISQGARIEPVLTKVIDEITSAHPDREIMTDFRLDHTIDVDVDRIGQLFSNLLGNAITHGAPDRPITINATVVGSCFELTVCNSGEAIPDAAMANLFQPFYRGKVRPSQHGLGLGLFIASEIAKAHGGTLTATSDHSETCFTFRMPVAAPGQPN
ncbi:Signal transduction histidine kinase [Aureimonas altamirensis DSM 21988]|uniref:histidine kinase n=1 Tax=Aureimonas altamirensis DSM 21988 TaxID=1121026 RepID=A0ABY1I402_9HYPH|nr:Signal transduction histidine kinase [Aureimonas altamirensis DSM 21988]